LKNPELREKKQELQPRTLRIKLNQLKKLPAKRERQEYRILSTTWLILFRILRNSMLKLKMPKPVNQRLRN
jgi:hypothetical protein